MSEELFLVWHEDSYGERTLQAITDNLEKWLADENERTELDEELEDFFIEEADSCAALAIYGDKIWQI